jgi:hypothetical protein
MRTYDYINKIVYTGIDVHKKTYSCVSICEGTVVKRCASGGCGGNPKKEIKIFLIFR